jgi:hypothetical protein
MQRQSVRQRRTVAIPSAINADGTWNGCYPKTVMSINWRASLVPAAAVIPAPRAYTNIAAVKTLVVCHRDAGLLGGQPPSWWDPVFGLGLASAGCWTQPPAVCPCSHFFLLTVRIAPAESLLHCRPKRLMPPTLATDTKGTWPVPGRHPVHHRGPPSLTPWKTQCAQSILLTAECPSMECRGIDRVWHWSCAGLGAHSGQPGGCSRGPTWTRFPPPSGGCGPCSRYP